LIEVQQNDLKIRVLLNQNLRVTAIRGLQDGGIARQFLEYVLQRLANQRVIVDQKKLHAIRRPVICRSRDSTSVLVLNHSPRLMVKSQ